jgi:hypothetical protein
MNVLLFSLYYCKLRATVWLGIHPTTQPLDLKWRWKFWQNRNSLRKKYN